MVGRDIRACWVPLEVAAHIDAMRVDGPLPLRTVLVPHARFAQHLRRLLVTSGRERLLAGTRFLTCTVLAEAILHGAGVRPQLGEEGLREPRIAQLIAEGLDPPGFGRALLHETVGWAPAFAATIGDLERAGLRPSDLPTDNPMIAGARAVWETADAAAGASWTQARVLGEAALRLAADERLLRDGEAILAVVPIDAHAVLARFVLAIPGAEVTLLAARPLRARVVERALEMFGDDARDALLHTHPGCRDATDLAIAATHLFEFERSLAATDRARAQAEPDGTLTLEEYDGVAAEIDAAVDWVARRILEGTPLDHIAVLAPAADPWCSLIASGLRGLDSGGRKVPIEVAGGLPLAHTSGGARVEALLRALEQHLGSDALVEILCCVRAEDDSHRRPSRTRVFDLVHSLGTRGGSPANPAGALEWRTKIAEAEARLSAPSRRQELSDQEVHVERQRARLLATARALRPAIEALCGLSDAVARGETLASLAPVLVGFVRDLLVQPTDGARIHALLGEGLEEMAADATCSRIRGPAVLQLVRGWLANIRLETESSDLAAVYVGTVGSAAGLSFDAVRIVGLAEGSIPPTVRGDPVLPDELRAEISTLLVTGADRAVASLHQIDMVVRATGKRLSLSAPRLAIDRTVREPSSLFIEMGAALGRLGTGASIVPSLASLRQTEIHPALAERDRIRIASPFRRSDWHDRLAASHGEVPQVWRDRPALDLLEMVASAPTKDAWHPMDGLLAPDAGPELGGLGRSRPTSAWRLNVLLQCPHRFLYEHVLDWEEPSSAPPGHELDPITFGGLVHAVAERFFARHGAAFARQDGDLDLWRQRARAIAADELDAVLETYGLDSQSASSAVRRKLATHVDRLLEQGWSDGPRRFVATEWAFGIDEPVRLTLEGGDLFVRGRIDVIESGADEAFVGDIKTGKCKPRRGRDFDPTPRLDLQIGIYSNVIRQHAPGLDLPQRIGAGYVHTDDRRGAERSFVGADADALRRSALGWLETARGLLAARAFPRTPDATDCKYCPFQPVCGEETRARSARLLEQAHHPALVRFRTMKAQP